MSNLPPLFFTGSVELASNRVIGEMVLDGGGHFIPYTPYLYYYRPRQHMTVPRKLPTNTRDTHTRTLNVGTEHKTRQGGINYVPL